MEEYFSQPETITEQKFAEKCTAKLKENFIHEWRTQINIQDSKLRTYCRFKDNFKTENYLLTVNSFQLRKTITKFRCSDHKLEVEVGRHKKIPMDQRICRTCNKS